MISGRLQMGFLGQIKFPYRLLLLQFHGYILLTLGL